MGQYIRRLTMVNIEKKMKAYEIEDIQNGTSRIIFATSMSSAKYKAFVYANETNFMAYLYDIKARRCKEADSQCKGREFMEWNNPDDRLFLVKELGWTCVDEPCDDCTYCVAHEFCDLGMNYIEEY